ncbi:hypothetical protein KVA01_09280 [Kocuria varians]|uniref:Uncharacterized protein n=1 Tax=Kocuria varians TaxID=1272 RepID=A0A4Y4D5E3_KOCVA|nr:hypothetical protein [Kocuria varians]GEC98773.1 hypothetical protein KVA01_09280 [Kocuria varians]
MPNHVRTRKPRLDSLRQDLLQRGLPLVLGPKDRSGGLLPRSAPALFAAFIVLAGFIQFGRSTDDIMDSELTSLTEEELVTAGSGLLIMASFPLGWWLLRVLLRHVNRKVAADIGIAVVVALLVLPLFSSPELGSVCRTWSSSWSWSCSPPTGGWVR